MAINLFLLVKRPEKKYRKDQFIIDLDLVDYSDFTYTLGEIELLVRDKSEIDDTNSKITYEPEADVLMYELADRPIDYAKEVGDFVVHFSKNNTPVLIEILEASKFLDRADQIIEKKSMVSN